MKPPPTEPAPRRGNTRARFSPSGLHVFCRSTGQNLLFDEIVVPEAVWAKAPRQVSIALTNICDLKCAHCFAPKTNATLPFDRITSWLHELDDNGTLGIGFGGGEPTLYRRFAELCAYAARNTRLGVTFTTHGHHLDEKLLKQLNGNVHFVRVSMDGIGNTYERIRGRSFVELERRLGALSEITPFGINYMVNSATLPDIGASIDFAKRAGASEFLLLPEQVVNGRGGIDNKTAQELRGWVKRHVGGIRLTVSEKGSDGMPTSDPFKNEAGLRAYAHIDASGVLKPTSYAAQGTLIDSKGILVALAELHAQLHASI